MRDVDVEIFSELFNEACRKCFGHALYAPFTETESKQLYQVIFEETGLTVGWKSLKNYSIFILSPEQRENPSIATLDTLARYVKNAPYTMEPQRKKDYSFWYKYKEQFLKQATGDMNPIVDEAAGGQPPGKEGGGLKNWSGTFRWVAGGSACTLILILVILLFIRRGGQTGIRDSFHSVEADSLAARGWLLLDKDSSFWERRGENPGYLTLYTLKGDNWPDHHYAPGIPNLLVRSIPCEDWTVELHLKHFIPRQNWQQAGILLMEDTTAGSRSLRISLAYNDYNGALPRKGTILLQSVVTSDVAGGKPEELAHIPLFDADSLASNPSLGTDLEHSALRIEKQGEHFRILYAGGMMENGAFKEAVSRPMAIQPRYVGLFALKGFVDTSATIPVCIDYFSLDCVRKR